MLAWLVIMVAVLHFSLFDRLDTVGLVGPDEPRYAAIAREMAESGDWVTPRLHGKPWFEKPILYYWAAAVQYRIWGDSEYSARSPSASAAATTTLVLGWLAWQSYGWGAAAIVVLLFPTTVAAIGFGRAATADMLFTASLALAMAAAAQVILRSLTGDDAKRTGGMLWLAGFGAALGLAMLAKGPAGPVLAGGSVALWTIGTRRWRDGLALAHPLAVASFAAVALPWYMLCAARNPEFVDVFLISHNVQRYLTPVFRHEQPVWFFGPVLLVAVIPWTLLLAGVARDAIGAAREGRWRQSVSFFFLCWAAFPVLFFSFSQSKLPGYVLPAIPAMALLMARSLSRAGAGAAPSATWPLGVAAVLLLLAVGAATPPVTSAIQPRIDPQSLRFLAATAGVGGLVAAYLAVRRKFWPAVAASALTVSILVAGITRTVLSELDAQISPRETALFVLRPLHPGNPLVAVYRLQRAWHYGLNYYLRQELPEWTPRSKAVFVVTTEAGARQIATSGFRILAKENTGGQRAVVVILEPAP